MKTRWLLTAALALGGCDSGGGGGGKDASRDTTSKLDAGPDDGKDGLPVNEVPVCEPSSPMPCPPLTYATWLMPSPPGVPSPNSASYGVRADEAKESVSGLTWQRTFTEKKTWSDAVSYCSDLNLGGVDDWRMPSRIELVSLVDFTRLPSIDQEAFPNTANDYFWSASPAAAAGTYYSVYFGAGLTAFGAASNPSAHVRCVRGGGPGLAPRFDLTATTALDRNTQLTWQRRILDQQLPWALAKEQCVGLGNGWRLPSTKELQTVVDETKSNPSVDSTVFLDTPAVLFWTSTPVNRGELTNAVFVDLRDGTTEEAGIDEAHWLRCVR